MIDGASFGPGSQGSAPEPQASQPVGADPSREPFECYSPTGMYRAEVNSERGWNVLAINCHGDSTFVDWTDTRGDAVSLARMHGNMELPL